MNKIIYKKFWTVDDVVKHRDWLFVYGDNNIGKGKGGQAVIRDESKKYNRIVLPSDGFGTGLAKLPIVAPNTYKYLMTSVKNMCEKIQ